MIIVIIFGTSKIPEVGSALGRAVRDFKETKETGFDTSIAAIACQDGGKATETRELRID